MKRILYAMLFWCLTISTGYAQSNPIDKKMEKAYNLIEKNKVKEAEEYVEKILIENPDYGPGWIYLSKIRYKQYKDSKNMDTVFGNMVITTKDSAGNEIKGNDSLAQRLSELLVTIKPSKKAYNKYIYTLRKATTLANDAYYCSQVLRNNFVDKEVDTAVNKKALNYFDDAEREFEKKNYHDASRLYKRALDLQPDFYKAALYMGDCFYFLGNYADAITSFKASVNRFPDALEPRKFLIDAYAKEHLYQKAVDESIEAICVYPDFAIQFAKFEDALFLNNQRLNIKWTPRDVLPNKIDTVKIAEDVEEYIPVEKQKINDPWNYYVQARNEIVKRCNDKGIIENTSALRPEYMEVLSWEYMLSKSNHPSLDHARNMQKEGYLDCYAMVTCFHFDFYDQFSHFATANQNRIREYFKKFIVAEK